MDCSPADSSVPGIFQARLLEWIAISYSRGYFHLNPAHVETHQLCVSVGISWVV